MHKYLVIISLFTGIKSFGQNIPTVIVSVLAKEQLLSKVQSNPFFREHKLLSSRYDADTIEFNAVVYSDIITQDGRTDAYSPWDTVYQIVTYSVHDSIFFKRIDRQKDTGQLGRSKPVVKPLFSIADTTKLMAFIEQHNRKYHSSFILQDFLNKSSSYGSFGFLCGGYVPHVTDEAYALAKLVKMRDSMSLKKFASSFSAQERAFGSAGLFFLLLKGQILSKELLDLIATNQESKVKISYCGGCIIGEQTLSEALEIMNLKSMYHFLVEYKLL